MNPNEEFRQSVVIPAAQFVGAGVMMPMMFAMAERGQARKGIDTSKMPAIIAGSGAHVPLGSVKLPEPVTFEEAQKIIDEWENKRKKMNDDDRLREAGLHPDQRSKR